MADWPHTSVARRGYRGTAIRIKRPADLTTFPSSFKYPTFLSPETFPFKSFFVGHPGLFVFGFSGADFLLKMRFSILLGLAVAVEGASGAAVLHHPRQQRGGVISAPVWRRDETRSVENDVRRRDHLVRRATGDTVPLTLDNPPSKLLYYANSTTPPRSPSQSEGGSNTAVIVTIGTPPQPIALQLDTGSSDIWVQVPYSQLCQSRGNPCAASGTYDNSSSSTYLYVNSLFNISYGDGTQALGDYGTETFAIGGSSQYMNCVKLMWQEPKCQAWNSVSDRTRRQRKVSWALDSPPTKPSYNIPILRHTPTS